MRSCIVSVVEDKREEYIRLENTTIISLLLFITGPDGYIT
jgi:hypothetical protein